MVKFLVVCSPQKMEFANGFAAGCESMSDEDVTYEVKILDECSPQTLYVVDELYFERNGVANEFRV